MLQRNLELPETIIKIIEERKASYGAVVLSSALALIENHYKNAVTIIKCLHKAESKPEQREIKYKNFLLIDRILDLQGLKSLLDSLFKDKSLVIDKYDIGFEDISGRNLQPSMLPYFIESHHEYFKNEWPLDLFIIEPKPEPPIPYYDALVAIDSPYYPYLENAIKDFLKLDVGKYPYLRGKVIFILPNYKAKIERIIFTGERVLISILQKEISKEKLMAKLWSSGNINTKSCDVAFKGTTEEVSLGFKPLYLSLLLMNKENEEILDKREVLLSSLKLPEGVKHEITEGEIEQIILGGENDQVEFKASFTETKDIAETIVAFANTSGGRIFVGVSKDCQILTLNLEKAEERVNNIIGEYCDPRPNIDVTVNQIRGKSIVIVNVPEGDNKPYLLDGKVFVRVGSTDRGATRYELDNLRKKDHPELQI